MKRGTTWLLVLIASHGAALAWGLASRQKVELGARQRPAKDRGAEERVDVSRFVKGRERGVAIEVTPVADGEELLAAIRGARGARELTALNRQVDAGFPEFRDWCKDFADSRMSADEVLQRTLTAFGEAEDADGALREFIFRRLFPMNAAVALDWLRGHRKEDWQGLTKLAAGESLHDVPLEKMLECAGGMSWQEVEGSGLLGCLQNNTSIWTQRDPQNCLPVVQRLPAGALKDRLLKTIEERRPKL